MLTQQSKKLTDYFKGFCNQIILKNKSNLFQYSQIQS